MLAHVTTTLELLEQGAPVDLVFQSVAGTAGRQPRASASRSTCCARPTTAALALDRGTVGTQRHVLRDRAGLGAVGRRARATASTSRPWRPAPTRCARRFDPLLVNTVVGFIGPEYLYDGKQIIRAGLEDHFCGKLLGVPMGVDVCYTNHAEADADDTDTLLLLLGAAGCSFVIAVPGGDDVMLHYQSLSFHDVLYARQVLGLRPAPEFEAWLGRMELLDDAGRVPRAGARTPPSGR